MQVRVEMLQLPSEFVFIIEQRRRFKPKNLKGLEAGGSFIRNSTAIGQTQQETERGNCGLARNTEGRLSVNEPADDPAISKLQTGGFPLNRLRWSHKIGNEKV